MTRGEVIQHDVVSRLNSIRLYHSFQLWPSDERDWQALLRNSDLEEDDVIMLSLYCDKSEATPAFSDVLEGLQIQYNLEMDESRGRFVMDIISYTTQMMALASEL
jgi:phage terminase small subunit